MVKVFGAQHQIFAGVLPYYAAAQPAVGKFIDPDSAILAAVKAASPHTTTITRIYTGAPTVDDAGQHPDPEQYGRDYASLVYSRLKDPAHCDYLESENEPNDHYGNLTEFIKRLNAFLVGFSRRAKELGFRPLGPNFSTGYPEVYVPGTDYQLWPNAWQGLVDGLRALSNASGGLGLHEYDAPDLFRLWSDVRGRGYLVGRHKAVYASLPSDLQALPLFLSEFGVDWLVDPYHQEGGFWHNRDGGTAPAWMCQQMRDCWTRIYSTTAQLKGVCFFLWGRNDSRWTEYDIARTDTSMDTFTKFFAEDLPPIMPPPEPAFRFARFPLVGNYPVTQAFGENPAMYAPFGLPGHDGEDEGCPVGTPVYAVADGVVSEEINAGNYGLHIRIDHIDGWQSLYAHLSGTGVTQGMSVTAGHILGYSGATGNVTGPHLHFGLFRKNHFYTDANGVLWPFNIYDCTPYLDAVRPGAPAPQEPAVITPIEISQSVPFLAKRALQVALGQHIYGEVTKRAADGKNYILDVYALAGVGTEEGHYADGEEFYFDPKNGFAISDKPPAIAPPPVINPPPGGPLPYAFPQALTDIGAVGKEGSPIAGKPFYRLNGASTRTGISAFMVMTVIGAGGIPVVGAQVVNLFPDGHGEVVLTDGSGAARFQFGASSAFSNPGGGPFTVFVAEGAVKDDGTKVVTWKFKLSDTIASLGDWLGTHTEIYVQFVKQP